MRAVDPHLEHRRIETVEAMEIPPFATSLLGPRVVFGTGSIDQLPQELDDFGLRRIMLIAERKPTLPRRLNSYVVQHFSEVRQHVPTGVAAAAVEAAIDARADGLVCIGGGSATGTAKAVALRTNLPIIAVPLSYAGSEMTPVYGLTEGTRKQTGRSEQVRPRTVIYDPALSTVLPAHVSAVSAINALAHCVSGVYAAAATPITDMLARAGVEQLALGLPAMVANPHDIAARSHLSFGACLAGTVLAQAGSSLHHTICHVLGGAHDLPHAETHAALLPHVARYLQHRNPAPALQLAAAIESEDLQAAITDLLQRSSAAVRLCDIGFRAAQVKPIAEQVVATLAAKPASTSPSTTVDDIAAILTAAL